MNHRLLTNDTAGDKSIKTLTVKNIISFYKYIMIIPNLHNT